jgi:hypothetical protein
VSEEADEPESKSNELHPDLMFDGRKWQPIVSLGTVSQLLEGCAKANESVQRRGPNIRVDKERLGARLRFGLGGTNQDKRKTRLAQGRVKFRVISVHVTQATSQVGITNQEVYMAMVTRRGAFLK